jgi:hypothetical protein
MNLSTVNYKEIKGIWPSEGKHILAQYNEKSIIVYQSYKPSIAEHAVKNKCFLGCDDFNPNRCTWIKTNFLWMMYRCGWNTKKDQERTLAIELKIEFFEEILKNSVHSHFNDKVFDDKDVHAKALKNADVVMQWDPDHHPKGDKMQRRAIQLGLKGNILKEYVSGKSIINIQDITEFVEEQRKLLEDDKLLVMKEDVYNPVNNFVLK